MAPLPMILHQNSCSQRLAWAVKWNPPASPNPWGDCSWCFLGTVHLILQEK